MKDQQQKQKKKKPEAEPITSETEPTAKKPDAEGDSMGLNILDKIGEGLTAFSDWVAKSIMRLFGSSNERYIRKLGYVRPRSAAAKHTVIPGSLLAQVNDLEPAMQKLSDAELKEHGAKWRKRLAAGETLDDLLPEVFAACREVAKRTKNMRHFDVQILGGIVLHRGNISEMVTGEGKTLVATLAASLNALSGNGVHIITVNDYLARRDCEWMSPIYHGLGLTCGFIQSEMEPEPRRKAYECDITYGTNSEFGFDYLRDNMKPASWNDPHYQPWHRQCQRSLNYAVIDEVDNILIDEARTPLIISGPAFTDIRRYAEANRIASELTDLQKQSPGKYYEIKEKEHTCHLTDEGIRKAEELAGVESFYTAGNMDWPHLIDNALKAHHLYHRDKEYAVMRHPESNEMSVIIIDEFTGRLMVGRQWSDGLHQAVEAKHSRDGVKIKEETQTLATVTLQNFFKLYKKLSGMTGTAMTEANEFWKIYKLDVIAIPTNKSLIRVNYPDVVFRSEKEKWKAVVDEIVEVHKEGRPMLVGTTDVAKSEKLSDMLRRRGVKHELLNAKPEYAAREAEIVAQAGRIGSVTIATNMAGRGTDIILGGNPETLAWARLKDKYATLLDVPEDVWKKTVSEIEQKDKMKEEGRKVAEMGGLHIIGTERHEARRIDNQLRGRSGRQGDPGSGRFYLSLEDELMRIFAGEWVAKVLTRLGMEEGQAIESNMVSRRIQAAQKKREEANFDIRKHLLEYDEVMDHQRKRIYSYRQDILHGGNCKVLILDMIDEQIDEALERFLADDYGAASFAEFAGKRLGVEYDASEFARSDFNEAERTAKDKASRMILTQVQEAMDENLSLDVEERDWNWQAMAHAANTRWGLKLTDRQLKQLGRDKLAQHIIELAEAWLLKVDLSAGKEFLEPGWGLRSLCDWARLKFQLNVKPDSLEGKGAAEITEILAQRVREIYKQKETELPVKAAMHQFMAEKAIQPGVGHRYDREGLYRWAKERFGDAAASLNEEDFRSQSRAKLMEVLLEVSKKYYPRVGQEELDEKLDDLMRGSKVTEEEARELSAWLQSELAVEVPAKVLAGLSEKDARQVLWNAFDARYRPEMRGVERGLLLNRLDNSWKNHLYTMDHLRSTVGLRGIAQEDPKTVYKREGMKEFDSMWEGVQDKVTDDVFRMEEQVDFEENLWAGQETVHETAPAPRMMDESSIRGQQEAAIAGSQGGKKPEPIRNRVERVGRNDLCPCRSGKKYKNCCMRRAI